MGEPNIKFAATGAPLSFGVFLVNGSNRFPGNGLPVYDPSDQKWYEYSPPPFAQVIATSRAPNGMNRVQHDGTRKYMSMDSVWIQSAVGPGADNVNQAVFLNPVDATHFDTNLPYTGDTTGGQIWGATLARQDFMAINGHPPTGGIPFDKVMAVGLRWKDPGIRKVAELVCSSLPYWGEPEKGLPVLNPTHYPNIPSLVGMTYNSSKYPNGGFNTGFFTSFYNTQYNSTEVALSGTATAGQDWQFFKADSNPNITSIETIIISDSPPYTPVFTVVSDTATLITVGIKQTLRGFENQPDRVGIHQQSFTHLGQGMTMAVSVQKYCYTFSGGLEIMEPVIKTNAGTVHASVILAPWLQF